MYGEDLAWIHAGAFGTLARGAAPEIIVRLRSAQVSIRQVVDAGCGAGPLAGALTEAGFEVTGIDASAELLSIARREVPGAHFIHGSLYDTPLGDCQAVLAIGEPLTYHDDPVSADERLASFFLRIADALPRGGLLIFDVIETGAPALSARVWSSGEEWAVLVETTEDAAAGVLLRDIQTFRREGELYRRGREMHRVRLFDRAELCGQLATAGFTVETAAAYGAQKLGPRRCAFFAMKS